jgi:RNA polymerase sigma-70 factor, ECF subfamily
VVRYQKQLFTVIYNIVLNHSDTQDVLMETLMKAYKNMGRFRTDAKFYTWIYQIAYHESINLLRKRRRSPQISEQLEQDNDESPRERSEFMDTRLSADIDRQMRVKELENKLNESLAQLSDNHRTVVNLFDIQNLSHSEIAEVMKCSEATVRTRLHYAHKQLQKLLRNYI